MKKAIKYIGTLIIALCLIFTIKEAEAQTSFTVDTAYSCDSLWVTFTNTSGIGDFYWWDFDDGSNYFGIDTLHNFQLPGSYNVTLFALDSSFSIIGLYQMPIVVYGLNWAGPDNDTICPGDEMQFYYDGAGDTYFWDFGDGEISVDEYPSHIYDSVGTYDGYFVLSHPCGAGTDTMFFTVVGDSSGFPDATFGYSPLMGCPGDQIQFYTNAPESETLLFEWDFGDGEIDSVQYPTHYYSTADTFIVSLTVTNICGNQDTYTNAVIISNNNPIGFIGLFAQAACPGDRVILQLFGDQTVFIDYAWDFGDGSPIDSNVNPNHSYADTGSYLISATVTNGCGFDTTVTTIAYIENNAYPILNPGSYGAAEQTDYCPGDSVLFFFIGLSDNMWHFGDGDSAMAVDTFTVDDDGNSFLVTVVQHAYSDTGTYWVSFTIINGCGNSATDSFQIVIGDSLDASADFVWFAPPGGGDPPACQPVDFISFGGSIYNWYWGDGDSLSTFNSQPNHTYSAPGDYDVTLIATNSCGNSDTITYTITIIGMGVSIMNVTSTSCGLDNGMATASPDGGIAPFTYMWNDAMMQTNATAMELASGTYTVVVTDSSGCTDSSSVSITAGSILSLTPSSNNPSSCGATDGTAGVSVSGGSPGYTYLWDDPNNQSNATAMGLSANTYSVMVTDSMGCVETATVSLSDPGAPVLSTNTTMVACKGGSDGTATVTATSGTIPYTYLWDDPGAQFNVTATGLMAGTFAIVVIDGGGCSASSTVTVTEPSDAISLDTVSINNVSVNGGSDGSATVVGSGGTTTYTYAWNTVPAQASATATGLSAGNWIAVIIDGSGCVDSLTVTVTEPPVGILELIPEILVRVVPNPNSGRFTIEVATNGWDNFDVEITNMIGQRVYSSRLTFTSNVTEEIDLSSQVRGMYFVTVKNAEQRKTVKVVLF